MGVFVGVSVCGWEVPGGGALQGEECGRGNDKERKGMEKGFELVCVGVCVENFDTV